MRPRKANITVIKTRLTAAPRRLNVPPKKADAFYLSLEWRQLIDRIKRERFPNGYPRCEKCETGWDIVNNRPARIYGDHIKEIKDGGSLLDPKNILLLCAACHGRKSIASRKARMHG